MIFYLLVVTVIILALTIALYPLRKSPILAIVVAIVILPGLYLGYQNWGSFEQWQHNLKVDANKAMVQKILQDPKGQEQLVLKLKAQLKQRPGSAKGWYLLGRLFASHHNWNAAENAFSKAYALKPHDERIAVNYIQSLWQNNQQKFNPKIRNLFKILLQKNSNQPDALAMLALDYFSHKKYKQAIAYWEQLLAMAHPQSEEALALRKAIAKAHAQDQS